MIINGGTLLSRQKSIDARSRHSRSAGSARSRGTRIENQRGKEPMRGCLCVFLRAKEGEKREEGLYIR